MKSVIVEDQIVTPFEQLKLNFNELERLHAEFMAMIEELESLIEENL